jgi:two-component system chemotaxis response regulator CheB
MSADTKRVVVVGSSAGGLRALEEVLGALPSSFPVPIVAVQHR